MVEHGPTTLPVATKAPLKIYDTGSYFSDSPIVSDALQINVWLLRNDKDGRYHIRDPEDLRPLAIKDYLACYLSADPEAAVRRQIQRQPEIATAAARYLTHLDERRILREPDLAIRTERLLPYFISDRNWDGRYDARNALIDCGPVAGPYLLGIFESTDNNGIENEIIDIWGKTRYAGAIDTLIKVLEEGNEFWAGEHLKPGWWNDEVESTQTRIRRERYSIIYSAVNALDQIGAPRARPAIEATRSRWLAIQFDNPQIVDACDHALQSLDKKSK